MTPSTSASSSDFHHRHAPKRMRLGTKSCAECRRRRVRCTFPPEGRACEACSLHGVECTPQKPATSQRKGPQQHYDPEKAELQRRLASLEAMVRHISTTVNLDPETTAWGQLQTESESHVRLKSPSTAARETVDPAVVSSTTEKDSNTWSKTDPPSDSSDELDQFEDAPLVNLFKDALKIERPPPDNSKDRPRQRFRTDYRIKAAVEDVAPVLPTLDDLRLVLEATERFWCIWPMRPPGQGTTTGASRILSAQNFIVDSMNSGRPLIIAKALLWLALCMHQLPRDFACQGTELRDSRGNILRHFLTAADTLLSIEGETGAQGQGQGQDLLECLQLQMKISIDMGRPRKAWLTNRRAMNTALLLGFQNRDTAVDEQNIMWRQLWHTDRMLSVILGLPCGISDAHPSLAKEYAGSSIESQLMHELAIIAGRIVDRNMNHKTVNYSVTMDIDQDLERCKARMPSTWWKPEFDTSLPFEIAQGRQTIKLFYFSVCKTLHMPYMFKKPSSELSVSSSSSDKKYELSRMAALEACRECIRVYKGMRENHTGDVPVICDLMDFLAFSATITLVVDLLPSSSSSSSSKRTAAAAGGDVSLESDQDWELVNSVSAVLNDVANKLSCSVAGQGSNLLERLIKARHGQLDDAEPFEAVVPYFGKVRIGRITKSVKGVKPNQVQKNTRQVSTGPGVKMTTEMTMDDQSQSNQSQAFIHSTLDPSLSQPQSTSMWISSPSTSSPSQENNEMPMTTTTTTTNTVEFNFGDTTTSFGQCCSVVEGGGSGGWMLSDDELAMDWESFVHVNTSYDWSQFFESAMPD